MNYFILQILLNSNIDNLKSLILEVTSYETGELDVPCPAGKYGSGMVMFEKPFLTTPVVEATFPEVSHVGITITDITLHSFKFKANAVMSNSVDYTVKMKWIASIR